MGREILLSDEDKAELAYSQSGVAEYLNAERNYWESFFYGADVWYEEETKNDPNFKNIACFIDALFTSSYLMDMQYAVEDYRFKIGDTKGKNRFGDREKFDPKKHSYSTHPKALLPVAGQSVECIGSQVSTIINGTEHILSEGKWDIVRPNAVEEMAEINERIADAFSESANK